MLYTCVWFSLISCRESFLCFWSLFSVPFSVLFHYHTCICTCNLLANIFGSVTLINIWRCAWWCALNYRISLRLVLATSETFRGKKNRKKQTENVPLFPIANYYPLLRPWHACLQHIRYAPRKSNPRVIGCSVEIGMITRTEKVSSVSKCLW